MIQFRVSVWLQNGSCPLQATSQIHILNPLRTAHKFAGPSLSFGPCWAGLGLLPGGFLCIANTLPFFRSGLPPSRHTRKLVTQLLQRLPSGQSHRHMRPFNQSLLNRMGTLGTSALKNVKRNMKFHQVKRRSCTYSLIPGECFSCKT
jgi:hypothetical protein